MTARVPGSRLAFLTCLAASVASAACFGAMAQAAEPMPRAGPPRLLAHYMPWFVAKPASPVWGWHWTMDAFDPEQFDGEKRPIASHYYPLIGPYDSGDPAVLEYHLLLMKLAGFDGLVVDWYGRADHLDYPILHRNTAALFPIAERFELEVAICYEDQTIPRLVEAGKLAASDRVRYAREEIGWLRENWFSQPCYLRLGGRPVLLSFGQDGLTDAEWQEALPARNDGPVYLSEHRRRPNAAGAFDWPVPKEGLAAEERFAEAAKGWPVAMPVAFPRFHDVYSEAKVHESFGNIPDAEGRTYETTLRRALTGGASLVQVATWNDWGEGTAVEPSVAFGYRDLEVTQRLRRELVEPAFAPEPEELRLAHRLYLLRSVEAGQPKLKEQLDEISRLLATGSLAAARQALDSAEADGQ